MQEIKSTWLVNLLLRYYQSSATSATPAAEMTKSGARLVEAGSVNVTCWRQSCRAFFLFLGVAYRPLAYCQRRLQDESIPPANRLRL